MINPRTEDVNCYVNRPFFNNDTHGLFIVLFADMEVERILANIRHAMTLQSRRIPSYRHRTWSISA